MGQPRRARSGSPRPSTWRFSRVRNLASEEDPRDLMRPNAWAGNAPTMQFRHWCEWSGISHEQDCALGIEKANHIIEVGDATAPMRDVPPIGAAECQQLFAFGGAHQRQDIRIPAEAIVDGCAVVGCAGLIRLF